MFWGIFLNLVIILAVTNGVIWVRSKFHPVPATEDRAMFGAVASSFGGADFWGAAIVVVINFVASMLLNDVGSTQTLDESLLDSPPPTPGQALRSLFVYGCAFIGTWAAIAWRNVQFLDWKWSGAVAVLYFALSIAAGLLVVLIAVL